MKIQHIGTLSEGGLHRDLKLHYASFGGKTEQQVGKYVVDVLDGSHIYEIQTANLGKLGQKLNDLVKTHTVTVVYPIVVDKVLVKEQDGKITRRRSPRKGGALDLFQELVHIPNILEHPSIDLELAYVEIEEVRIRDLNRAWRRRHWVVKERNLVRLINQEYVASMGKLFDLLASELPREFTTKIVSETLSITRSLSQKFVYCFRLAGVLQECGKDGNAKIYERL